jgi:predicted 3-demethylubiquinone-9 3-methyltransferase (glyoxalase superfamily)
VPLVRLQGRGSGRALPVDLQERAHRLDRALRRRQPGPQRRGDDHAVEIEGQKFLALNGGPQFAFTPAISLIVDCATQAEVDELWERLGEGGKPGQCGWLTDKFGVSWQIVPSIIPRIIESADAAAIERVMRAVLPMKKLDIARLQQAYEAK